jgi:hypothetical protein
MRLDKLCIFYATERATDYFLLRVEGAGLPCLFVGLHEFRVIGSGYPGRFLKI